MLSFDLPENIKKRGFLMISEGGRGGGWWKFINSLKFAWY